MGRTSAGGTGKSVVGGITSVTKVFTEGVAGPATLDVPQDGSRKSLAVSLNTRQYSETRKAEAIIVVRQNRQPRRRRGRLPKR